MILLIFAINLEVCIVRELYPQTAGSERTDTSSYTNTTVLFS